VHFGRAYRDNSATSMRKDERSDTADEGEDSGSDKENNSHLSSQDTIPNTVEDDIGCNDAQVDSDKEVKPIDQLNFQALDDLMNDIGDVHSCGEVEMGNSDVAADTVCIS